MATKPITAKVDLSKAQWKKIYQTNHFVFFVTKGSLFKKFAAVKCEKHFLKTCGVFGFPINWKKRIKIYIAPNQNIIQRVTGRKTFGSVIGKLSLISVYAFHPHEITHVIFNNCLGDSNYVLKEGVAVLYGWFKRIPLWKGKSLRFWLKKFKAEKSNLSFEKLFCHFQRIPSSISYPISGAIVQFLINEFGVEKFKNLYRKIKSGMSYKKIQDVFQEVTGSSLDGIEKRFWRKF
jgi:hypothetical protein